jgi:signal transduction histidine kinase
MFSRFLLLIALLIGFFCNAQVPDSGLSLWLRADKGVTTTGSNVTAWKDQGKRQNDAITTTDTAPQLMQKEVNGMPAVRFNGRNTGMQTRPVLTFPKKRGTIVLVARINDSSLTSGKGYGTFVSTYFGKGVTWQMGATPYILYFYDGIGGSGFPYATISPNDWLLITLSRNEDNNFNFYRIDERRTSFEVKNNQPDTNQLNIGYNGRIEVLNGDIGEIIMYDRVLSPAELSTVHTYLMRKYNIYWPAPAFYESWWFKGILIALVLIALVFITRYIAQKALKRRLKELERQHEIDRERLRISREMHDDIGAGLTRIALISEIAKQRRSNTDELQQIAETSRQLVSNMSEIIWSLNPAHRSLSQLLGYLREELGKLLEPSGIKYNIQFPGEAGNYVLTNEQKRNILLVTKEIVHNAVKHSKASDISIEGEIKDDHLCIIISDNGKGFDTNAPASGNGMKNLRHRFEQLDAEYKIAASPGNGVITNYRIPLKSH